MLKLRFALSIIFSTRLLAFSGKFASKNGILACHLFCRDLSENALTSLPKLVEGNASSLRFLYVI